MMAFQNHRLRTEFCVSSFVTSKTKISGDALATASLFASGLNAISFASASSGNVATNFWSLSSKCEPLSSLPERSSFCLVAKLHTLMKRAHALLSSPWIWKKFPAAKQRSQRLRVRRSQRKSPVRRKSASQKSTAMYGPRESLLSPFSASQTRTVLSKLPLMIRCPAGE